MILKTLIYGNKRSIPSSKILVWEERRFNQEYVYLDIKGIKQRKERLGAASDFFFFDRLTMRNVQLEETEVSGWRVISKNKLTNRTIF